MRVLLDIVLASSAKKIVVFSSYISRSIDIQHWLREHGISAEAIYADMEPKDKFISINKFTKGDLRVLIGNETLARGLELDTSHIIIYNIPHNGFNLIHRIGRTGRFNKPSKATLLVRPSDAPIVEKLQKGGRLEEKHAKSRKRLTSLSFKNMLENLDELS